MAQNFNIDPYYDDFDPSKNFHKILFKPGYAVQARELTQSQTILQSQISKFADNIFKQNTPVTGGKVTTNLNCYYLKLNAQYNNANIVASQFLNKIITDSTGTILAKVIATSEATGTNTAVGDPPTLIISYISGVQFSDNTLIIPTDESNVFATTVGATGGSTCTGIASAASISEGVFYVVNGYSQSSTVNEDGTYSKYSIGNFVSVQPKTIILDKYTNSPSYRIGLSINETIVDSISDTSLLDPAVGASNYQAPGADRYQIVLTLDKLPLSLGNDDKFIELLRIENGKIVKQVDSTVYSVIDDYFAKRDYETNGDYIVEDFKLTPSANTADSTKWDLSVGKGIAYVRGYRIENQSDLVLTSDRARTTNSIDNNTIYVDYGSYFVVDSLNGLFNPTTMPSVDLHCVSSANINTANAATYTSTVVGSASLRNISYVSNTTDANTNSYVFKTYVTDVSTNALSDTATSGTTNTIVLGSTVAGKFSSVDDAYVGASLIINSGRSAGDVRTITSYNGTTKTATVDSSFTLTPDNTSQFSVIFNTADVESIVKQNGTYGLTAYANINNSGKVGGLSTGDTIFHNSATPEMLFSIGYPYVAELNDASYTSTKIFRSKAFTNVGGTPTLTLSIPSGNPLRFLGTGTLSSDVVKQNFIVIDHSNNKVLDFCTSGNNVTISSSHDTATFTSSAYSGKTVDIIATVSVSNADSLSYVLKRKTLVTGDTTTISSVSASLVDSYTRLDLVAGQAYIDHAGLVANTTGKISLFTSDVKKIRKIIDTKGETPSVSMFTSSNYDVTNLFTFDNGQRDSLYDHATISLKPGASLPKGNLLVVFDYYAHTGGDGYFSVESYINESYAEIPVYTSKSGTVYRLTDVVDFRPVRKNSQTEMVYEYTGNPSVDDTGILIPTNLSEYITNYSYYLGRKDKLVLTKDKSFQFIKGTPAVIPSLPVEPDGSLVLANITLDPYTSYIPGESTTQSNISINKVLHKRWAKSDITDLQARINNLEYYTSLSLLEQNAQSLQVPDVNGLNRFKNGILVDDFSSYSTADTFNSDYAANINLRKKTLSPVTLVDNFQLQNPVVLNSLGTLTKTNTFAISSINGATTNIFTLPYTTANAAVQPLATSVISLNPFAVTIYEGVAKLNPPMDNWVDNTQSPAVLVTDPSIQVYQQTNGVNITNAGDFATIPGTTTSSSVSSSTTSGNRIDTTTTTTTSWSSLQNSITTLGYSPVSSIFGQNNGYLTNISILPYIRPQQIIFKSKGLLVNAPIKAYFDGVDVSQYITTPNTIELSSVSGTFKEDDVVGFYLPSTGKFYAIGRVVSMYTYPNGNVRLYISNVVGAPNYSTSTTLQNAKFDANGNYISSSASGTINAGVTQLHTSGAITGVGGSYTPVSGGSAQQIYKVNDPNDWGSFLNQYGVWGDLNASSSYSTSFVVNIPTAGAHTFIASSTGTATITANGTTVMTASSSTTSTSVAHNLNAGNVTIAWSVSGSPGPSGFALVIKDGAGNIVFQSTNPPNLNYNSVAQEIVLPMGGAWFTGVTKVKLGQTASSIADYYVGAKFNVTSKYVYQYTTQTASYVPPPPAPSGGGGRVICTHMTEIGEMDPADLAADLEFTKRLSPEVVLGYHSWAFGIVGHMRKAPNDSVTEATKWIARQRTEEIKYQLGLTDKPNYAGKYIRLVGELFCWGLGTLINNLNVGNIKSTIEENKNKAMEAMKDASMADIAKVYDEALK